MSPLISVIIPTYNRRRLLLEAIESVEKQTYSNVELIVVDDGSTDETAQLGETTSPLFRYTRQENRGPAAARNHGARIARGEWLAFLDSDDIWMPDKLARQWQTLEAEPEFRAIYTNELWIRRGVRVNQRRKHRKYSGWIYPYCLPLCIVSPSSILLHRELWEEAGGMDESLPAAEDYDLWLRLSWRHQFRLLDELLITKRGGHDDQLSHKFWGLDRFRVRALLKMMDEPKLRDDWRELTRRELCGKCRILAAGYAKHGRAEEAVYYVALEKEYAR